MKFLVDRVRIPTDAEREGRFASAFAAVNG
jgi:hypothetical protein